MNEPSRRYRPPRQSSYANTGWWASHGAELIGAIGGFLVGFVILLVVQATAPNAEAGWIPWLSLVAGALGLRWIVRRQFRERR